MNEGPASTAIDADRDQAWAAYADRLPSTTPPTIRSLLKDAFISGWLEGAIRQSALDVSIVREELGR
jgi:hypothetical protein